jgi:2'-5' RNA ligase
MDLQQYGIISVLDDAHYRLAEEIWTDIERHCCPRSPVPHPYPHFTYVTAPDYDLDRLDATLRQVAERSAPFQVTTAGLGVWNRGSGIYLVVNRSPSLSRYHERIWQETAPAARPETSTYHSPDLWEPHITLALGPQMRAKVPDIIARLYQRNLQWQIEVTNLTVVFEDETHKEFIARHEFGV